MFPYKPFIQTALSERGFTQLTDVQEKVIPLIMDHKDLVVQSATGTGKTHSYLIPIFEQLDLTKAECQVLISAPTRELATQIFAFAKQIAQHSSTPIDIRLFSGGTNRALEIAKLEKSQPHIAIGTPGKLKDLVVKANALKAFQASVFIVDEADMTLDEGFLMDVDQVAATMNESMQMLVFSATIPEAIQPFLKKYLKRPEMIFFQDKLGVNPLINHGFIKTKGRNRMSVFDDLLTSIRPYLAIVFCNTKESAEALYAHVKDKLDSVVMIHGGLEARNRKALINRIRANEYQYIIATDIISRGIDLDSISHIINYELPQDIEFYVHRSGRTGRMNKDGQVLSLYDFDDERYLDLLEAKGIHSEYFEVKDKTLIPARERQARQKKDWRPSREMAVAKSLVKKPTKVKPGYKKKYQQTLKSVEKKLTKKRTF